MRKIKKHRKTVTIEEAKDLVKKKMTQHPVANVFLFNRKTGKLTYEWNPLFDKYR